jgi:superfamily II DNA or RNA helicase
MSGGSLVALDDSAAIAEVVKASPGLTVVELRDALRHLGRSSVTSADVVRVLASAPHLFIDDAGTGRWFPATTGTDRPTGGPASPGPVGPPLYTWQREALDAWRAAGCRGVVEAVTGTGKTTVALTAAVAELARGGQVLVIVPTRELQSQWLAALGNVVPAGTLIGLLGDGHNRSLATHDVVIAVVNSARDTDLAPRRPGGLLIADECHRYASKENRRALHDAFPRRLGLSATFARPDDKHLEWLLPYFGTVCYELGYERARHDNVIAPFDITLVCLHATDDERAIYDEQTDLMSKAAAVLIARFGVPTEPLGAFLGAVSAMARSDGPESVAARRYLAALQERRRVLENAQSKIEFLHRLVPAVVAADRTLVFTTSIAAAERATAILTGWGVPAASVHSEHPSAVRREHMEAFRDGGLTALIAPNVLDEGIDVASADLAIVVGTSRSRRQMVQRMGRIVRRKADGRRARFVVGFIRDTIEDPAFGAHGSFLHDVTAIATTVVRVTPSTPDSWAELVVSLAPWPVAPWPAPVAWPAPNPGRLMHPASPRNAPVERSITAQ